MDTERQEAYRHLLYTALLHLRTGQFDFVWWSPKSWRRMDLELRRQRALADCFHNLALFSVHRFENFDEGRFWEDVSSLGQAHGSAFVKRYRRIFDEYVAGRAAHTC